jgi:hypothetical protein
VYSKHDKLKLAPLSLWVNLDEIMPHMPIAPCYWNEQHCQV